MPEHLPTYVILHHTAHGPEHWDFMLDTGNALATWQLLDDPSLLNIENHDPIRATRIGDHRRAYLNYEGPVSGGRGKVHRIDQGTCEMIEQTKKSWTIHLKGTILQGTFRLTLEHRRSNEWSLQRLN
jgi:hypothetical protein